MKYNKNNIKKYKGKVVSINYSFSKDKIIYKNNLSGVITAITTKHILFIVNNDNPEIILNYSQLIDVIILKKNNIRSTIRNLLNK